MKPSVRLEPSVDRFSSLAGVDEIIARGDRAAYVALIGRLLAEPHGPTADIVLELCAARAVHKAAPEFFEWPMYAAVGALVTALRQFP